VEAAVAATAAHLSGLGVGTGDVVAVMLANRAEIVTTMFAAWRLGAALTPVNPALTDAEVRYQLADSGARVLVAEARGATLAAACGVAHLAAEAAWTPPVDGGAPPRPASSPADVALLVYTSGTTGAPKGCVLDHANLNAMVRSIVTRLRLGADDRSLLVLPLFHCNGLIVGVLAPLAAGGSVVVAPRFDAPTFWDLVERERPTYFSAVPTMYALVDAATTRTVDTSSLRFVVCGAAPMPADLISRFEQRFDVVLVEGYGLSECSVAATINPLDGPRKAGTVGPALPGVEVEVAAPDGRRVSPGERGEVVIRGANVMRGYLGRPEATAEVLRDGWLHTGDVGFLDDDGYLTLVDRTKDMIIRGGENIYPKEIENVLYEHPAVLEAAVTGQPDPTFGEVPVAHVALRPGASATPEELREHCLATLAKYKVPRSVVLHDSLPKNSVGKLLKTALRD
jgi:acyl-CoA synthetase (AMP-forming)/AMP-acid ligase II